MNGTTTTDSFAALAEDAVRRYLPGLGESEREAVAALLRDESTTMSPERLREMRASRLSFANQLVDRVATDGWSIVLKHIDVDGQGRGVALYQIEAEGRTFQFGAFSHGAGEGPREGRIRENEFDFFGVIADGPVDADALNRDHDEFLRNAWGGRCADATLGWTVANRSNRLFDYAIEKLSGGEQPDVDVLKSGGGYLIRNAGYYGNGRHGSRSWFSFSPDHAFASPYSLDMFTLYMWRRVSHDIVDATAAVLSDTAVKLTDEVRAILGIGNSSGIGTVAALVRWPSWLSGFVTAREVCLAYARTRSAVPPEMRTTLAGRLRAAVEDAVLEQSDPTTVEVLENLHRAAQGYADTGTIDGRVPDRPLEDMVAIAQASGDIAAQEWLNAILIDLYPDVCADAANGIGSAMATVRQVAPEMPVRELRELVYGRYRWALETDLTTSDARARFWYRSEENGENRRGETGIDPGVEKSTFVDALGVVKDLYECLSLEDGDMTVGRFLLKRPHHSLAVSRVQLAAVMPFSEIQANLLDAAFRPADGIRFFLRVVLGIEASVDASDQWVRGIFFRNVAQSSEEA